MLNFKSFCSPSSMLASIGLIHMIRNSQLRSTGRVRCRSHTNFLNNQKWSIQLSGSVFSQENSAFWSTKLQSPSSMPSPDKPKHCWARCMRSMHAQADRRTLTAFDLGIKTARPPCAVCSTARHCRSQGGKVAPRELCLAGVCEVREALCQIDGGRGSCTSVSGCGTRGNGSG